MAILVGRTAADEDRRWLAVFAERGIGITQPRLLPSEPFAFGLFAAPKLSPSRVSYAAMSLRGETLASRLNIAPHWWPGAPGATCSYGDQ
jgi:hypothetical protein